MSEDKYILTETELTKLLCAYWGSYTLKVKLSDLLKKYPRYEEEEDFTLLEE